MSTRYLSSAICLALLLSSFCQAQQLATNASAPGSTPPAPATPTDPYSQALAAAMVRMNANDLDGALAKLTEAIKLNPHGSGAYIFRASLYCQKKLWAQAEQDFNTAAQISPGNVVIKFNLVEVKFLQKQYDAARPGYVALENDPEMGDLAAYKVFLCDLFGGHEAMAKKDLDVFNQADTNPSYYFSNAAWDLFHKNIEDARGWLVSASHIYPLAKNAYYAQSLRDLGYLPIPEPQPAH